MNCYSAFRSSWNKMSLLAMGLTSVLNLSAADGDRFEYEGIHYEVLSEKERTCRTLEGRYDLTGYHAPQSVSGPLVLPAEPNGYHLVEIGTGSFSKCPEITSVTLPEGVISIGAYAFDRCEQISQLTLPSTLTVIGEMSFQYCRALESLTLPASLKEIREDAFFTCSRLQSVLFNEGLESIATQAFAYCGLTEIHLPSSLTTLAYRAFTFNKQLATVHIPAGVTTFVKKESPFVDCSQLAEITVAEENTAFMSRSGALYNKAATLLYQCPAMKTDLIIDRNIVEFGGDVVQGCRFKTLVIEGDPGKIANFDRAMIKFASNPSVFAMSQYIEQLEVLFRVALNPLDAPYILDCIPEPEAVRVELLPNSYYSSEWGFEDARLQLATPDGSVVITRDMHAGEAHYEFGPLSAPGEYQIRMLWKDTAGETRSYTCYCIPDFSGIGSVSAEHAPQPILGIYDLTGRPLPTLQPGINIVVRSDGSVSKILM